MEKYLYQVVITLNRFIAYTAQILAIIVILIGIIKSLAVFVKDSLFKKSAYEAIRESRLELGHSFSLGLGFLIGASILQTMIAPTWDDIGKLSAIIAIRTILNVFLLRESVPFMKNKL
jgi:uncharacterized membrane protein